MKLFALAVLLVYPAIVFATPTFEGINDQRVIEGSNCHIEIRAKESAYGDLKSVYVEFERSAQGEFFVYGFMAAIPESEYQQLFVLNQPGEITDYTYNLVGDQTSEGYDLTYSAMKLIGGFNDVFLHEELVFHFDSNRVLVGIEAVYLEKWPFPYNFTRDETVTKFCTVSPS